MAFDIPALQQAAQQTPPQNLDLARYILTHANVDWSKAANLKLPNPPKSKPPSVFSRIIDLMSRPSYAVDEMARRLIEHEATNNGQPINPEKHNQGIFQEIGDILHGGLSGLAGTQKTTWSKTFNELNPKASPVAKYGGGFLLDLVTDPTTYFGPGLVKSAVRGARTIFGAGKVAEKGLPEAKGIISVIADRAKPTPAAEQSQRLPQALGGASPQVRVPDFHAPGMVVSPKSSVPKVNIPEHLLTPPEKSLSELENVPTQLTKEEIDALSRGGSRKTAQILASIYKSKGYSVDARAIEKTLASLPKSSVTKLPKIKLADAHRALTIARGDTRRTAEEIAAYYKRRGHDIDIPKLEQILDSTPKDKILALMQKSEFPLLNKSNNSARLLEDYIREAKNAPVHEAGLAAQDAAKAGSLGKLQKGAALKRAMVNPATGVNVERAGDIIDKIANGGSHQLTKPTSKISEASPAAKFWAERTAREYETKVLRQANKFSSKAAKNNPAQQANLFLRYANKIAPRLMEGIKNPNASKFAAKRYTEAYRMMKIAENYFRSIGLDPTFWDGSKVALTDVIDELGGPAQMTREHMTQLVTAFKNRDPSKIINPEIQQAIENVRARDALQSANWVRLALDQNSAKAKVAEQVLSKPKYNDFVRKLVAANKVTMSMATDASPVSISSAQHLLRNILQRNGTLPQLATDAKKTYIQLYATPGAKKIKWLPVQEAQTKALAETLGSKPAQLGKALDKANQAENWFLSRFATWYGMKDLRPSMLASTMGAINNAARRAKIWNTIAKTHTPNEIYEAFRYAQGRIISPASQKSVELGNLFKKAMEDMFASSGVTDEANKAATVASRSGLLMQDINKQLRIVKSHFKFTNARGVKDFLGNERDFSKGTDWLKSWEEFDVKEPLDFIMRIETAVEQVMHQYSFLDEIGARWGSKLRSSAFSTPVAVKRLSGLYFPKELAPQIGKALETWNQVYDPKSDLIRFLDRVTRAWKAGVTIYAPSHHIRNFIGDVYLSWLAGVNSSASYNTARRVLFSQKNRYDSLASINDLVGKHALSAAMTRGGDKILTTRGGVDLTAEQVYIAAHSNGLLSHVSIIEDLIGDPLVKVQPLGGRGKNFAHAASELREHYVRLAHFVDVLKKSKEKDLPRLFFEASNEVRKWHPDGMDLTKFEREKMKRIFPFYSWTRKTIPLLVEGAITKPGKILAYPRAMYAIQGMAGIDAPSVTDPFPEDQLFPNWIKAKGIGPVLGESGNYNIINPSNPFNDLISQYAGTGHPRDIIGGVGSSLNPLARVPAELLTGQTVLGTPVDQDLNRYATEQIPIASLLSRLGNVGVMGPTNKANKQGMPNWSNIINFLTALGYQPTAPYIKEAEFEKKGGLQ